MITNALNNFPELRVEAKSHVRVTQHRKKSALSNYKVSKLQERLNIFCGMNTSM